MTTAEKLARLNELRAYNGKAPLKAWKQSVAKLDQAIEDETLENINNHPTEEFSEEEILEKAEENERQTESAAVDEELLDVLTKGAKVAADPSPKDKKVAKKAKSAPKGETIRSYAEHLLRTEPKLKHKEVADKVREKFKDASTSAASVAWYASKLKKK
jgi:hypothetical protein